MEIQKELFWILTTLVTGVIGLLIYLWKTKDKRIDEITDKLDTIITGMSDIKSEINGNNIDRKNLAAQVRENKGKLDAHENLISDFKVDLSTLKEWKRQEERAR